MAEPETNDDTQETRSIRALQNANLGPREAAVLGRNIVPDGSPPRQVQGEELVFNINVVPAEAGETDTEEDEDGYGPAKYYESDDTDDSDYVPEMHQPGDDSDSSDDEDEEYDDGMVRASRSGRRIMPVDRYGFMNAKDVDCLPKELRSEGDERMTGLCSDTEPETDSDSNADDPDEAAHNSDFAINSETSDEPIVIREDEAEVFGIILAQLSLKQGLREWGDKAEVSAGKEMQQLHDMSSFFPRDAKSLTREERISALRTLIFLKEKHDGNIKSRTCVDG